MPSMDGTLQFIHRLIRNLILPSNAGPNDPSIIIGPDIRQEVIDYYNAVGFDVIGIQIFQQDRDHYVYLAYTIPQAPSPATVVGALAFGTVQFSTQYRVAEAMRFGIPLWPALPFVSVGELDVGADLIVGESGFGSVQVQSGAGLFYDANSLVEATSFDPNFSAAGGGFSLGNGSEDGNYVRRGDWTDVYVLLSVGSTTNFGAGNTQFSLSALPVAPATLQKMQGYANNTGVASFDIFGRVIGTNCNLTVVQTGADVTPTNPFAFGNGDLIVAAGTLYTPS